MAVLQLWRKMNKPPDSPRCPVLTATNATAAPAWLHMRRAGRLVIQAHTKCGEGQERQVAALKKIRRTAPVWRELKHRMSARTSGDRTSCLDPWKPAKRWCAGSLQPRPSRVALLAVLLQGAAGHHDRAVQHLDVGKDEALQPAPDKERNRRLSRLAARAAGMHAAACQHHAPTAMRASRQPHHRPPPPPTVTRTMSSAVITARISASSDRWAAQAW